MDTSTSCYFKTEGKSRGGLKRKSTSEPSDTRERPAKFTKRDKKQGQRRGDRKKFHHLIQVVIGKEISSCSQAIGLELQVLDPGAGLFLPTPCS